MHFVKSWLLAHKTLSGWGYGEFQGRPQNQNLVIINFWLLKKGHQHIQYLNIFFMIDKENNNGFNEQTRGNVRPIPEICFIIFLKIILFVCRSSLWRTAVRWTNPTAARTPAWTAPPVRTTMGPSPASVQRTGLVVWAHLISGIKYLISNHVYNQYSSD